MSRRPRGAIARRWLQWTGGAVLVPVLLAVLALMGIGAWMRLALPVYNGVARLPGLAAEVRVVRDRHAVPHIFADGMADAYRALGYLHAQDRLLQMELNRRTGAGRLSEVMGGSTLPVDRFMRVLGLYRLAEAQVAALSPRARAALEAYVAGVNAYLADPGRALPPELVLLVGEPEPWRPADSLIWGKLMALQLSGNWRAELRNARLALRLTAEQMDDLSPADPPGHAATLPDLAEAYQELDLDRLAMLLDAALPVADASNEWVISGAHTASGKPLLANDPHLGFTAPGLWYLARIVTPELTLAGATVPGVPFHLLGHNGAIAWGLTTTHSDTQDLFVEKLDPSDPGRYLTPAGTAPFETREERIGVRFRQDPVVLTVRATRHGPVVSDIVGTAEAAAGPGHVLALAFPALTSGDRTPEALFRLNHARNADEVLAALGDFHAPQQNVAYADAAGRIGFAAAGWVPVRLAGNGMAPVPGWSGEYDWTGLIPFAELPQVADPVRGRIVNANNRIVGDGYPYLIATHWPEPHRADRIHELLDADGPHTVAGMARIQADNLSPAARLMMPELMRLAGPPVDARARKVFDLLGSWDYRMDKDRTEPLVYLAWLRALDRELTADELGEAYGQARSLRPLALLRMLTRRTAWCDDVTTQPTESCEEAVGASLDAALDLLTERLGDDMSAWRWGDLHKARFRHAILGRVPVLRRLFDILVDTDGGPFTVNRGLADLSDGGELFRHIHGPGYRAVYDLADLDRSLFMIATGQSGRPFSPHYADLTPAWAAGEYLGLGGGADELRGSAVGDLRLMP